MLCGKDWESQGSAMEKVHSGGESDHDERANEREHIVSNLNETNNVATLVRRCYTKRKSSIKVETQVDELGEEFANQSSGDCLEIGSNSNDHSSDEEVGDPCSVIQPASQPENRSKENEQESKIVIDDIPEPVDVQTSIRRRFATSTASTDSKKRKFFCDVKDCSSSFLHRATYIRHMNLHEISNSRCKICFKTFAKSAELLEHQSQIHNGQSHLLYPCSHCHKSFFCEESRDRHLERVFKDKTFICPVCSKIFHNRLDLNLHTKNTHQERAFSCKECGKEFKRETHVITHMKIHFPIDNNVCNVCNKDFPCLFFLKRHSKVHSANKHNCNVCRAGFTHKRTLVRHISEQHPKFQELLKSRNQNKKRGRIYQYKL